MLVEMVAIAGGTFLMGTQDDRIGGLVKQFGWDGYKREAPRHEVTIQPFSLSKYPITQKQYHAVMEKNPSKFQGWFCSQRPVECVSWHDAQAFCKKLSETTGKTYRLPTEAEWEYACRAGDDANELGDYAWYRENSGNKTHPVGQKKPNAWGLYDMSGNVWEWCEDNWHYSYDGAPSDSRVWLGGDTSSAPLRGGSYWDSPDMVRSASRMFHLKLGREERIGFRVCMAR